MRGYEITAWRDPRSIRKTMRGSGMVSPVRDVTVTFASGRSEVLRVDTTRLALDHPLVKQRPSLFVPCDTSDKATATRMAELTNSHGQMLESRTQRPSVPTRRKYGRHQLRPRRPQRSKLR